MKRTISIILAIILVFGCIPVNAFAAGNEETCVLSPYSTKAALLEITRDGAPIRTGPGEKYSTVVICEIGTVLEKDGTKINKYLNKWYEVTYRDGQSNKCYSGYVYSGHAQKHSHQYETIEYDGATYEFCDCGRLAVLVANEVQMADAMAVAATAGTLTVADGPFPLGDMIAIGLLITIGYLDATGVIPDTDELVSVYEDVELVRDEYENDACPIGTYRKVSRLGGTLTYLDKECMSILVAYIWVRTGNDVWCQNWETAYALGSIHMNGCFSEIDSGNKDYWYHFHLGKCTDSGKHVDVVGGHIFYGTSAITHSLPTELWW